MTYPEHVSTEILADHAEGLLGESENARVEAHLAECDDCQATALLLASIPAILAADNVGPMPVEYASRIDSALADLFRTEPPVPLGEPVAATPILTSSIGHDAGSNVVDLASRRKIALTGLRRVGTIAASMVLLIAGAALGIQTVGKDRGAPSPESALQEPTSMAAAYDGPTTPSKKAKTRKDGSKEDTNGAIFTTNGKILLPNGDVVTLDKKGGVAAVYSPSTKKVEADPEPTAEPKATTKPKPKVDSNPTVKKTPAPVVEQPKKPGSDPNKTVVAPPPDDPAAPGAQVEATPTTASKGPRASNFKQEAGDQPSDDPYVQQSRQNYNEDNFAALVMDLVAAAKRHNNGTYEPSSTGEPTVSPTPEPSMQMPADFRFPAAWGAYFQQQQEGRGPAEDKSENRVKRCAAALGVKAIAGDIALWKDQQATIVVTESENPEQVNGYVFYGNCGPGTSAQTAEWTQRVNRPADNPEPSATPVRRVGSVQSTSDSREQ